MRKKQQRKIAIPFGLSVSKAVRSQASARLGAIDVPRPAKAGA